MELVYVLTNKVVMALFFKIKKVIASMTPEITQSRVLASLKQMVKWNAVKWLQ